MGLPESQSIPTSGTRSEYNDLDTTHLSGPHAQSFDSAVGSNPAPKVNSERVLQSLTEGVALLDLQGNVEWVNDAFSAISENNPSRVSFLEAIGLPANMGAAQRALQCASNGVPASFRMVLRDGRTFQFQAAPIRVADGTIRQMVILSRDVTFEVNHQQKLAAIHQAMRELAALSPDQLAEMSVRDRIDLLKQDVGRLTHDLLHYDVIEIRLLDRTTGRLEPLLTEGMTAQANQRVLYARTEGNGATGYVAATGKSYLCPDTASDPIYLEGCCGARSSLTVPLMDYDKVIGTLNVESPELNRFGEEDLQFLEIFSREIAFALHTLDLIQAEKRGAASRSVETISREVALPVDEILNAATALLDRYIGHDSEMADKLRLVLSNARSLKQCIQRVGEDLAPCANQHIGENARPALRGLRVLVADNDDRVRRSAHAILGRFGCIVETAKDGQEAITMARLSAYDAILADIRLPDVSGYEIFRRLHDAQPATRVILMTAYGYDPAHSIVKARQEGLRHVLYKPFRVDQLLDVLAQTNSTPDGPGQRLTLRT